MFTRIATATLPMFLLLQPTAPARAAEAPRFASPAVSSVDDAATLLQKVQQALAKSAPKSTYVTAGGSGYTYTNNAKQSYWIKYYTGQFDLAGRNGTETIVRSTDPVKDKGTTEAHKFSATGPWPDQVSFWTMPFAFLAGAGSNQATVTMETVQGTAYQVVTFTPPMGQPVSGYITSKNVLDRIRTTYDDPARGKIQVEVFFDDWGDFNGVKYPRMIVRHDNHQLTRILIIKGARGKAGA